MKQAIFFTILILISTALHVLTAGANDDDGYSWAPRFYYKGICQEGRNICLGIMIPEDGLGEVYSVGRRETDKEDELPVFEDRQFEREEAVAHIRPYFNEEIEVYLFVVPDYCLADINAEYSYYLYDQENISGNNYDIFDVCQIQYHAIDDECIQLSQYTCNSMDLTWFYGLESEDDDTPNPDDDNDNTDSSDGDDSNDDDCNCGCDITGRVTSFPLTLFMFAIGIAALGNSGDTILNNW